MDRDPSPGRRVVVIDGCRTPFLRSGTEFKALSSYDLGRMALAGLLRRTAVDPQRIDLVIMGTVIADPDTSNVAREAALAAGIPTSCPAHTVTAACISSNVAFMSAAQAIALGHADLAVVGGTETLSDVPIRVSRPIRQRLIAAQKVRGAGGWMRLLKGLRPKDLAPQVPAIAEFSTGLTMGQSAERLGKTYGISREDQDAFALRSHHQAALAGKRGWLKRQIETVRVPPDFAPLEEDNGIRGDSSAEKLASLRPVFDRRFGTITAGNSSFLTDGASAVLLASEERARELGLRPLAAVVSQGFAAMQPLEELLLGPTFAIPQALDRAKLTLADVDVFEFHEAFAAQVLFVLRTMEDDGFARRRLGRDRALGRVEMEKLNSWGGSLAVGHPFGATGTRLVTTCCHRLEREEGRIGLVAACAAGALGYALVLERVSA